MTFLFRNARIHSRTFKIPLYRMWLRDLQRWFLEGQRTSYLDDGRRHFENRRAGYFSIDPLESLLLSNDFGKLSLPVTEQTKTALTHNETGEESEQANQSAKSHEHTTEEKPE